MKLDINKSVMRLIKIVFGTFIFVHLFTCFFYLSSKLNDFGEETWVYNYTFTSQHFINLSNERKYMSCMYWAL